ncbi:hypothetical protein PV350_46130, partial [Streptomyces sp. PA03-6a]|nr:hypothetical protein [Streptomyces sp. PA03-6a]
QPSTKTPTITNTPTPTNPSARDIPLDTKPGAIHNRQIPFRQGSVEVDCGLSDTWRRVAGRQLAFEWRCRWGLMWLDRRGMPPVA